MRVLPFVEQFESLRSNVETVVRGKREIVDLALMCLLARGHLLLEDVPGVGKTSLARAIAGSLAGDFRRIQFTADLLPSDITGVQVFDPAGRDFRFIEGPVFAHVVLADEINRASPKAQSALLEVMAEGTVSVGRTTYDVPAPFLCIATQNPADHLGTFLLPEAQLDRFMMRLSLGYLTAADEARVVADSIAGNGLHRIAAVMDTGTVLAMSAHVRRVHVSAAVTDYVVRIAAATRAMRSEVQLGVSARGSVSLAAAAQSRAAALGRDHVTPDDVKALAGAVLSHRLVLTPAATAEGQTGDTMVERAVARVPAPSLQAAQR